MEVAIVHLALKKQVVNLEQIKWFELIIKHSATKQFAIITNDSPSFKNFHSHQNLKIEYLKKNKLLQSIIAKRKAKSIIKKHQPKIVISLNSFLELDSSIPQIIFYHHRPSTKEALNLVKAKQIIVFTDYLKNILVQQFLINENNVEVVKPIVSNIFQSLSLDEITLIKDGYSDGRNYFLYQYDESCSEDLITILKAFSQFKKWQKTNMKLMVVSLYKSLPSSIKDKISTYKFNEDVVVLENTKEEKYALLLAAAYGFIHTSKNPLHIFPLVEAIHTSTAIITTNHDSFKTISDNAAILINENSIEEIANAFQELYKKEDLRNKLIQHAKFKVMDYNVEQTANHLWQIVQNAIQF